MWVKAPATKLTPAPREIADILAGEQHVPGLLDRYDKIVIPFGDIVNQREQTALAERSDKLIIESPQIFAQTILPDIVPRKPAADLK